MSTIDRETITTMPPLIEGQHLDRATFHERYLAMPEETRAELIEGIVYMAAAQGMRHSILDPTVAGWLLRYMVLTPGVQVLQNATVFLGEHAEHQPDAVLRILPTHGGRSRDDGNYYANGAELVVEISDSTLAKDLGPRLRDYERAGVPEYVVVSVKPAAVKWHRLVDGRLVEVPPGPEGFYRSRAFPGLWLDPQALLACDHVRLWDVVDRGIATPEHADFVARLAEAGGAG